MSWNRRESSRTPPFRSTQSTRVHRRSADYIQPAEQIPCSLLQIDPRTNRPRIENIELDSTSTETKPKKKPRSCTQPFYPVRTLNSPGIDETDQKPNLEQHQNWARNIILISFSVLLMTTIFDIYSNFSSVFDLLSEQHAAIKNLNDQVRLLRQNQGESQIDIMDYIENIERLSAQLRNQFTELKRFESKYKNQLESNLKSAYSLEKQIAKLKTSKHTRYSPIAWNIGTLTWLFVLILVFWPLKRAMNQMKPKLREHPDQVKWLENKLLHLLRFTRSRRKCKTRCHLFTPKFKKASKGKKRLNRVRKRRLKCAKNGLKPENQKVELDGSKSINNTSLRKEMNVKRSLFPECLGIIHCWILHHPKTWYWLPQAPTELLIQQSEIKGNFCFRGHREKKFFYTDLNHFVQNKHCGLNASAV